jgi:hypothetical protein
MLDAHAQKIGVLIAAAGAIAGSWMETAQTHISFAVLVLTGFTAFVVLINGLFSMCHAVHQRNKDLVEEKRMKEEENRRLEAEKRHLENLVCEERRRTGICPRSTFALPHDHDHS